MKKLFLGLLLLSTTAFGPIAFGALPTRFNDAVVKNQLAVGSTAVASTSAVLDLVSTTKGFNPPRMTTTQRDAISGPTAGLVIYNTTTSALNAYNGSAWVAVGSGTGSGVENMVTNGNAETDTVGWATFADAAANKPVDGTGGSATNLTFSRSTSSPLNGVASFSLVQTNASTVQGKGVSYDYTIDSAYQGRTMSVQFNFNASSTFVASDGKTAPINDGTTTTNAGNSDVEVFMYDVTNSVLLPVSPQVFAANGANNFTFKGTFPTSSNSTSYRFILMVATANANATGWTFKWDNLVIGPQSIIQGVPVIDAASVTMTPSAGFGTTSNGAFWQTRIGDKARFQGQWQNGTVAASAAFVTIPTGLSIDTVKMGGGKRAILGNFKRIRNGASGSDAEIILYFDPANPTQIQFGSTTASGQFETINGSALFGNSDYITFWSEVPITGWSSSTQMSNDASQRVVEAAYYRSSTASNTANTQINFDTLMYDTHGAVTTGASWKFTAPVSGYYDVKCVSSTNNTAYSLRVYKNGSANQVITGVPNTSAFQTFGSSKISLTAGDTIDLRNDTTSNIVGGTPSTGAAIVWISLDQGPTALAVADSIAAKYYVSSSSAPGADTQFNFDTKIYDTVGAVTTGASWKFTAPIAGKYSVRITVDQGSATNGTIKLYKNSTADTVLLSLTGGASGVFFSGSTDISLLAGDFIDTRPGGTSTINGGTAPFLSTISIARIGN